MKIFNSLDAAINFVNGLNIPQSEVERIDKYPHIFTPYDVILKHADCDIIAIRPDYDKNYNQIYRVEKRWYGGPISCSEALGLTPIRYKTPNF